MKLRNRLFALQDLKYKEFIAGILPSVDPETIIGIRTPQLRTLARELQKDPEAEQFLEALPHRYFEENQLHAFLLSEMKSCDLLMTRLEQFLPYVDNWATCDQLSPKIFRKQKEPLLLAIQRWLASKETYTIRFAVGMLMSHYLDQDFREEYLAWVGKLRSEEYYVNMMIAWYFATALAKQWDAALPYLRERRLPEWVHKKTIQKAVESRRITEEQKQYLRTLRSKGRTTDAESEN